LVLFFEELIEFQWSDG